MMLFEAGAPKASAVGAMPKGMLEASSASKADQSAATKARSTAP